MQDRIKDFSPEGIKKFVIDATGIHFDYVAVQVRWEDDCIITNYAVSNDVDYIALDSKVSLGNMIKPTGSILFRGNTYIYNLDLRMALQEAYKDNFRV